MDQDFAVILSQLPSAGTTDTVMRILEVNERIMKVYGPSVRNYQAAIKAISASSTGIPTFQNGANTDS